MLFDYVRKSFKAKLTLSIGALLFGVLSLYLIFFIRESNTILQENLIEQGTVLAENAAFAAELGVLAGDPTFAEASVLGISEREEVVFLGIYNSEGRAIALQQELGTVDPDIRQDMQIQLRVSKSTIAQELSIGNTKYYEFFAPIAIRISNPLEPGEVIGFARVVLSLDKIQQQQQSILTLYLAASIFIFLGSGAIAYYFTNKSTQAISKLIRGAKNIRAGNLKYRIKITNQDELGRLATSFNEMAVAVQETRERDKAINKLKSEFITIAAHQLRTPLSAMKWTFKMGIDGDVGRITKQMKEHLQRGYDNNERLIVLVDDLLDAARIEEGKFDYQFSLASLVEVVQNVFSEMRVVIAKKEIDAEFHEPTVDLPKVKLDVQKMRLAFMNILENAIHYTPQKGSVDVSILTEQDHILVTVQDTGIGIAKDEMHKLFTKFYRGSTALKMETTGSGLGLFIAKNIIEKHGGKIWLESEEGTGTTVYFTIPLA